jgi:hypothetical protein
VGLACMVGAMGGLIGAPDQEALIHKLHQHHDHVSHWWRGGYRTSPIVCWHGKNYGASLDTRSMEFRTFGPLHTSPDYDLVPQLLNAKIDALPAATLNLTTRVGNEIYKCKKGGEVRLIQGGRYLQRMDIMNLSFVNAAGKVLDATGRLEIIAWPDSYTMWLELTPKSDLGPTTIQIEFQSVLGQQIRHSELGPCAAGEKRKVVLEVYPKQQNANTQGVVVEAQKDAKALVVSYDPVFKWHRIDLPIVGVKDKGKQHLETVRVTLKNDSDVPKSVKLNFAKDKGVHGISGLAALYRDRDQFPTGIPLQFTKNWHTNSKGTPDLYQGPWVYVLSMLKLPPKSNIELEFCLVQNFWGTLPVASHAQLCVIGCGIVQLWDQAAIGSWGESICYNPDRAAGRSVITDLRALMVNSFNPQNGDPRWNWTANVGGGDFLIYCDQKQQLQRMTEVRTQYLSQGPNLTDVIYQGVTADGAIACTARVQTPRCQDLNRAYHHISYKVLKPVEFSRLAFYQLGGDTYNDHLFKMMARGDINGNKEEWQPAMGGRKYHRSNELVDGNMPWFSMHQEIGKPGKPGPWANRAMVLRSWKARLGGKPAQPHFSSYGTEDQMPSANVELSAPPDIKRLEPGDFVEADIELLVIPQFAKEYYGPDEKLRTHLAQFEDTWQPAHRQAQGGTVVLQMKAGEWLDNYPLRVKAASGDQLEFIAKGGLTFTPIVIEGLKSYRDYELQELVEGKWTAINQAITKRDFWQTQYTERTDTFSLVYNIDLSGERRFKLVKLTAN